MFYNKKWLSKPWLVIPALGGRWFGTFLSLGQMAVRMTVKAPISMPVKFTDDGPPVELEFVGFEYREQHLLELARGVEVVVDARRAPPGL